MKEIPPHNTTEMPFIGADLPADIAQAVGTGRMNPCTHQYWEDTLDAKPVPKVLPRGHCLRVQRCLGLAPGRHVA